MPRLALACSLALLLPACAAPVLSRDGQLVFQPRGAHGASVLTAHGVEFLDRTDIPARIERHSVDEPWRPATGFLIPRDGVFRETAMPISVSGEGLAVVVRTSDVLVPSWGGEVLLRIDALAPAEAFEHARPSVRPPVRLAIVLDAHTANSASLATVALEDLGERDRAAIVDSSFGGPVLPLVPGSNQTLLRAAVDRMNARAAREGDGMRDLPHALATARGFVGGAAGARRVVLVITDGVGPAQNRNAVEAEASRTSASGVTVTAVAAPDWLDAPAREALGALGADVHVEKKYLDREDAVAATIPPPGDTVLEDVTLTIDSVPAPAHVLEISGGEFGSSIAADRIHLGDLYAGEARTEMARVALPPFVPGESLELNITSRYRVTGLPERRWATQTLFCRYSDDVEQIANDRNGDVIAYGSALAMVRRLDRAFLGDQAARLGGLRPIVKLQAATLADLARQQSDPALGAEAEVLTTLLGAIDD